MMAHRFGPAQDQADNKHGLRGRCPAIGPLRATFHHGPEPSAPHTRPEIRLQSNPAPKSFERSSEVKDQREESD